MIVFPVMQTYKSVEDMLKRHRKISSVTLPFKILNKSKLKRLESRVKPRKIMHDFFFLITAKITLAFKINPRIVTSCFPHTKNVYGFSPFAWIGLVHYDEDNNKEKQSGNIPLQEKPLPQHILPPLASLEFRTRFFL